jgi:hypothetical protein
VTSSLSKVNRSRDVTRLHGQDMQIQSISGYSRQSKVPLRQNAESSNVELTAPQVRLAKRTFMFIDRPGSGR